MDDWNSIGPGTKIDRRATDWGLLSVLIGVCFLIMAPIQLLANIVYWTQGLRLSTRGEIEFQRLVAPMIGIAFLAIIVVGLVAAIRGWKLARQSGQAVALPLGGLLMCGLDVIIWLGLTVNMIAILNSR